MKKSLSLLKSLGTDYLIIYSSFIVTGLIYYIYIYAIGFYGDIWQFYTYLLYMVWGTISTFLSLFMYRITFVFFRVSSKIEGRILVASLSLIWIIHIWLWWYGNFLFDKKLLNEHPIIGFWFYQTEYMLLIMHFLFYIIAWFTIRYISSKD